MEIVKFEERNLFHSPHRLKIHVQSSRIEDAFEDCERVEVAKNLNCIRKNFMGIKRT